ncbi:MAG: ABC transporter ATP-binding protein [Chloroflexi bacterium]|nr:ABC transporter ATP-binding protein [Chloroflexota bacterium]
MTDLTVSGLTKSYGSVRVLDGVDLHVPAGSFTAILGPSGCGKTTLLRLIAGFDRPDDGRIVLGDRIVYENGRSMPPEKRHIGYVVQEGALFPHLTVADNITFGLGFGKERNRKRAAEMLEMVGLDPRFTTRYPHQLSGGQQQRVALARALAPEPTLILLDEPFASLDAALREGTRRAVAESLAAAGATTILVTHDQAEALSLADQVAVMRRGRLTQVAAPLDLYRQPVDVETAIFLGEAVVLPATICGGQAECALGRLPVKRGAPDGQATVMVRPEQIVLNPVTAPGGTSATVENVIFYGHDATVHLALSDGCQILARAPGFATPGVGERLSLAVQGTVHVFEAAVGSNGTNGANGSTGANGTLGSSR